MRKGFTIIELLVVIAIMGILATITTVAMQTMQAKGRDGKRVQDVKEIQKGLELYFNEKGGYPGDGDSGAGSSVLGIDAKELSGTNGFISPVSGTNYLIRIPADPTSSSSYKYFGKTSAGGDCSEDRKNVAGCASYLIEFTLEKGVAGLPGVDCTATPSALVCS